MTRGSALEAVVLHDVLDPGVVVEPLHRQVLAVPGMLEPSVGHLGDKRHVGVDPHAAAAIRAARPALEVQTDDASPYLLPLANLTASSSSLNRWAVTTGPKISFCTSSSSWRRSAMSVGS